MNFVIVLIFCSLALLLIPFTAFSFADHSRHVVESVSGSGTPDCENTIERCYDPHILSIKLGDTVLFSNSDTAAHTFVSGTPDGGPSGIFDSGLTMPGNVFAWTSDTVGKIPYFCMVHPWMQGMVIVNPYYPDIQVLPETEIGAFFDTYPASYENGEKIRIVGTITNYFPETIHNGHDLTFTVISPENDLVGIGQATIYGAPDDSDGYFEFTLVAGGPLWQTDGTYKIKMFFADSLKEISFEYNILKKFCGKLESEYTNVIHGTHDHDVLNGTKDDDLIFGYGGDDTIHGFLGNDCIHGGLGNDSLYGNDGADTVFGGGGRDMMQGGLGNDKMYGNDGNDIMEGNRGNDIMYGGAGDDQMEGNRGADTIHGNDGSDRINGKLGNDKIYGGDGNDILKGEDGNDKLYGNAGNDDLFCGSGKDNAHGGKGSDYASSSCENTGGIEQN